MNESSVLKQALVHLGSSADDVANTLRERGIRGGRNAVGNLNPILRYVRPHLWIDDYHLEVTPIDESSLYLLKLELPNGVQECIALPEPVIAFLDAFNSGAYADLELPS